MGQYYKPVLLDEANKPKAWLLSHYYDNGLKLMEHSYIGNTFVNAVLSQIVDNPMRVAWIGDYSCDPYEGTYAQKIPKEEFEAIFDFAWKDDYDNPKHRITPEPISGLEEVSAHNDWYLLNHTKKTYVDLGDFIAKNSWKYTWKDKEYACAVNPLPLLTACGNDRGGGDYHSNFPDADKVGEWAFDLIELCHGMPAKYINYQCEEFRFKEEY